MKNLLFLLLFPCTLMAQVTVKTDEFTGKVTMVGVVAEAQNDKGHISSMVAMRVEGATYVVLHVTAEDWVHIGDQTVHALSGASKTRLNVKLLKVSNDTEIIGSTVFTKETMGIQLSTHLVNNPLLIRVGSVVYTVPESVVADVREIGRKL